MATKNVRKTSAGVKKGNAESFQYELANVDLKGFYNELILYFPKFLRL